MRKFIGPVPNNMNKKAKATEYVRGINLTFIYMATVFQPKQLALLFLAVESGSRKCLWTVGSKISVSQILSFFAYLRCCFSLLISIQVLNLQ